MNDQAYCKNKVNQSGSNFYYSFLFLNASQKEAMTAIYAFCREIDDIIDEDQNEDIAAKKLAWWSDEIERLFDGNSQHPITKAIQAYLPKFHFKKSCFDHMLQGMYMDLSHQNYQNHNDLLKYCYCVASTVGLLATEIFTYQNDKTLDYAVNIGLSLQLINIIRDVGEDARRGRIYIPIDLLRKYKLMPHDILELNDKASHILPAILSEIANEARNLRQQALSILPNHDRPKQICGLIMAEIYHQILNEIEYENFQVLHRKITITPIRKFLIAWCLYRKEKKQCATL